MNAVINVSHPRHKPFVNLYAMSQIHENLQKQRQGLNRVIHAFGYSMQGLQAAMHEPAFKQEVYLALILIPLSFYVGNNWVEISLLSGTVIFVLTVELLNTGLESAIDRVGPQWHDLSKRCKDLGSAAVLLSILFCMSVWLTALILKFSHYI